MGRVGCRGHFNCRRGKWDRQNTRWQTDTKRKQVFQIRRSPGRCPEAEANLSHRYRPSEQWGETEAEGEARFPNRGGPKTWKSTAKPALLGGAKGTAPNAGLRRQTPTHPLRQGEPVWAGAPRAFLPAHAPSPLPSAAAPPPPNHGSPQNPARPGSWAQSLRPSLEEREHSLAPRRGRRRIPPGLVDRRVGGGGGGTRPYPNHRLLLRRPPFAVPEAQPPGPPQPPCPRPPRPLLTWERLLPPSAPPSAPSHRPAAKQSGPIGLTTGGEGVLPFLEAPPGLLVRLGVCACAESARWERDVPLRRQWLWDGTRDWKLEWRGKQAG